MDLFFMSVWDDARQGTKYYLCHGEDTPRGYHTDTLPILWLPDCIAVESTAARIISDLWRDDNTYYLSFEPGDGKHFFAPVRRVFELLAELKRFVAESQRNSPVPTRTLGRIARSGEDSWTMYGAGGGAVAGVDVGGGQVAFDVESFGGGGGSSIPDPGERGYLGTVDGEWGSVGNQPRSVSRRNREQVMHITDREVNMRQGEELPVYVRFHGGWQETCTVDHYNRMIDSGRWTGMERLQ